MTGRGMFSQRRFLCKKAVWEGSEREIGFVAVGFDRRKCKKDGKIWTFGQGWL